MTHYLRRNGKTLVDVEATKTDISSVVCIPIYSELLLTEQGRQNEIIADFDRLQELRGEFHETPNQQETPDEFTKRVLQAIRYKYDLEYVTN